MCTYICTGESQRQMLKERNQTERIFILYDFTHMNFKNKENPSAVIDTRRVPLMGIPKRRNEGVH